MSFNNLWKQVSHWGVDEEMPFSKQRQVILSNQIALSFIPLILVLWAVTIFINHNTIRAGITFIAVVMFMLVLWLNKYGRVNTSRFMMSLFFTFVILVITTVPKMLNPNVVPVVEYFQHRFLLLGVLVLPLLLLDFKRERPLLLISVVFTLGILLFLDLIYSLLGISIYEKSQKGAGLKDYYLINAYDAVIALILVGSIVFLKNINQIFENRLLNINQELEEEKEKTLQQNQEILAQNEELYQQQKEIGSQREFIENRNQELDEINKKLIANSEILKRSFYKLKDSEKKIKVQNELLLKREKQIASSLNAALTIQSAILPYEAKLDQLLKNYFLIYRPKDVVSGDFFWLNKIEGKTILAVVDCTGHGVPGAFMSLIGNTLLDKIVRVWRIVDPAEILHRLHQEIKIVLRQEETQNNYGMDLSVLCLEESDSETFKLIFAGAKSVAYLLRPGEMLLKIKGDRRSIGGAQNESIHFENQPFRLSKGDFICVGSDGFVDQNNACRKSFGEKHLMALLKEIATLDTAHQKQCLENALDEHMVNTSQRDDILLLGFFV